MPSSPRRPASAAWSAGSTSTFAETAEQGPAGLRRLHELKTGRLIGASVECVCLLDGHEPATGSSASARSRASSGLLFQIVDDILDVTGTDAALGKPQGSDERHGKRTYVTEYGLDGARDLALASHRKRARVACARRARRGSRARRRSPTSSPRARAEPTSHMSRLLDRIDRPAGPPRPDRGGAAAGRAGGARAHHRHGR